MHSGQPVAPEYLRAPGDTGGSLSDLDSLGTSAGPPPLQERGIVCLYGSVSKSLVTASRELTGIYKRTEKCSRTNVIQPIIRRRVLDLAFFLAAHVGDIPYGDQACCVLRVCDPAVCDVSKTEVHHKHWPA